MPSELKDRLAQALALSGKSKIELARYCGVSHPSVTNWFNGRTKELTSGNAMKAAVFLGVSVQWLTTGKGDMKSGSVTALHDEDTVPEGFIEIPEYRVEFGCGDRCNPSFEEVSESKPAIYRLQWFRDHGLNPAHCKRLKVSGDSMIPILFDGDSVLCDCSSKTIISGKIYAFCFGGSQRIKRLFIKLNGGLIVHSENPNEQDEEIAPDEMDQFVLIGRVVDRSGSGPF